MSYELRLEIEENSAEEQKIDAFAEAAHISREEAALQLILAAPEARSKQDVDEEKRLAAVHAMTGSLKDMPWIMDQFWEDRRLEREMEDERDLI